MTEYIHRYFIFVQWNKLTPANAQAKAWDPDTGGEYTFGDRRLSADGEEPATHSACDTPATNTMRTKILAALDNVPFYKIYSTTGGWTMDSALADAGLQVINEGVV